MTTQVRLDRNHVTLEFDVDPDQAWFWTPKWQDGEREASEQIAAGEGEVFDSGDNFLRALDPERAKRDGV